MQHKSCRMSIEKKSITQTNFQFENQSSFYKGKVRDVYSIGDHLVMIASDRISAFDHVLPRPIPFKGQVLNQIAAYFLEATEDIVPNWLLATPDPNVAAGLSCEAFELKWSLGLISPVMPGEFINLESGYFVV